MRGWLGHQMIAEMVDTRPAVALHTLGTVLAILGGLLLALSAFLPWVRIGPGSAALASPVSSWDTVTGIDGDPFYFLVGDDGFFFLAGGILIAALGLWTSLGRPKAAPIMLTLGGLAFGLLGWFEFKSIMSSVSCCDFAQIHPGEGIWWIYTGAVATFLAGLLLVRQKRVQHPRLSVSR